MSHLSPPQLWGARVKETDKCRFVLNGLRHANKVLGEAAFDEKEWRVIGEYVYDEEGGRHQAFYSPIRDTVVLGELIRPYDRIQVEQSLKYSSAEAQKLWRKAGMVEIGQWRHGEEYGESIYTPLFKQPNFSQIFVPLSRFSSPSNKMRASPTFSPTRGTSHSML